MPDERTNEQLLREIDSRIEGCVLKDCSVCPKIILTVKELAKRLGIENYKPWLEIMRENNK